jgi:NAD-dependent DNA ligase
MGILSALARNSRVGEALGLRELSARNAHGQPAITAFRSEANIDRQIDELIGIAKGIVADGHVSQAEAEFLLQWLETNRAARTEWPARVLYPRLVAVLADGVLDVNEESEILELILQCVGGNAPARGEASMSTILPYSQPEPTIEFARHSFCFTGKFFGGTRNWCEDQVLTRGAQIGTISKDLDYLVIGEIGSRDWIHSTHGRKIEKAVDYNSHGCRIGIISEQHWHGFLS